jgi:hypothetical protein
VSDIEELSSDVEELVSNKKYTAIEVFATDKDIPAGTIDDQSGVGDLLGIDNYKGTSLIYNNTVSASTVCGIGLRVGELDNYDDIKIEWGDDTTSVISDGFEVVKSDGSPNGEFGVGRQFDFYHDYKTPGKRIVKIYGNIYGIKGLSSGTKGDLTLNGNLICRIWDEDLPCASNVYCWKEVLRNGLRMLQVRIPFTFQWPNNNLQLYYAFRDCKNLVKFLNYSTVPTCQTMNSMFRGCVSLTDLQFEVESFGVWKSIYGGYSNLCDGCTSLQTPIYKIVPFRGWGSGTQIHIENMFRNCTSLPPEIERGNNDGTSAAEVLWDLEPHGYRFWKGSGSGVFAGCPAELLANIPTSWGGTK